MLDNRTIDLQSAPLQGNNGELFGKVFFYRDITREIEVNRTKNEFISLATHQLQTPLTAIRWILEELTTMEKGDKKKMPLIKDASDSTERVIQLVSDMLNVSRLDAGMIGVDSRRTELVDLLENLIKEASIPANKKEIEIKLKKSKNKIYASFDKSLISEVILNLLSNAIRYSETHKKVTVSVKENRESIEIEVKDSGIGISEKDQKELFQKFFRSNEAGKYNTTGSGLGLYVIKKILDACKGKIKIKSKLGKGSTFTVQLPLNGPINIKEGAHILIRKGIN